MHSRLDYTCANLTGATPYVSDDITTAKANSGDLIRGLGL